MLKRVLLQPSGKFLQPGLDGGTAAFQGFVDREAGPVRGDLEEVAAGFAEVKRPEIIALHLARARYPELREAFGPVVDRRDIRCPERNVVNGSRTLARGRQARLNGDMQFGRSAAFAHAVDMDAA